MLRLLVSLFLLLASAAGAEAQLGTLPFSGASASIAASFGTLKLGAGGQVTGIDIASDGTKVVKTDVGGGWYCAAPCASGGWIQVISATSMPSGDTNVGWDNSLAFGNKVFTGLYEIRVAPSNTSIFYVYYVNTVYKGTYSAGAVTLAKTTFSTSSVDSNDSNTKFAAYHMAVDPQNANVVVAGGANGGIQVTLNGGTTWSAISGLCTPTGAGGDQNNGYYVGFDPTSGTTTNSGVTVTAGVYIGCYGSGVYHSTTGPAGTFSSPVAGGPTTFKNLIIGSDGSACVADNSGGAQNLWGFFSAAWTNINSGTQGSRNQALVQGSGKFYAVIDSATDFNFSNVATHCGNGGTWTPAAFNNLFNQTSPDIGWISADSNYSGPNLTAGGSAALDTTNNRLYVPIGIGVMYVPTPTTNTGLTWTDHSAPIEELVANRVIGNCGSAGPFTAVWDRGIFNNANSVSAYPATHGTVTPSSNSNQIVAGWDLDCSNTVANFVVCLCNWFGVDQSGYSLDGGGTWTKFAAFPTENGSTGQINGSMATGDDQTILWAVQGSTTHLFYTTNRGGAWTQVGSGLCANIVAGGWSNGFTLDRNIIASDKSLTNTFYFYNNAVPSFYKMTFSGGVPTCVQTRTSALDTLGTDSVNDGFNVKLKAVPGQAQNLFYTSGAQTPLVTTQPFWRSTDGGVNWSQVSNVKSVQDFGFGAAKPGGGGYPAIYVYGLVNGATVLGIYRSDDNAVTWNGPLQPCPANLSQFGSCPNGSIDLITTLDGDGSTYGKYYTGYSGTGFSYGIN